MLYSFMATGGVAQGVHVTDHRTIDKMRRLTGIPAAVGKGVYAPEGCLEPEPFFAELARREIKIEELVA